MVKTGIWKLPVEGRVAVRGVNVEGDEQADRSAHVRASPQPARTRERWRIGTTLLEVSEPRFPCWKLGVRFGDPNMLKRFAAARRPGAYLRITEEGHLAAGDRVEVAARPGHGFSIASFAHAFLEDRRELPRLLEVPGVSEDWRDWVRGRAA